MKYIKKYENGTAYNNASLILPNISLISSDNSLHINPDTNTSPQYDYVEIGGIKWATKNLGATKIGDYGLFFQWGNTQGYTYQQLLNNEHNLSIENHPLYNPNDSDNITTKYNAIDQKTELELIDDPVHAALGGNWRTPTGTEYTTLFQHTKQVWVHNYNNTLNGLLLIDNSDGSKQLYFPACGYFYLSNESQNNNWESSNEYAQYWTSTLSGSCSPGWAPDINIMEVFEGKLSDEEISPISVTPCNYALPVRGIIDDNLNS